MNATNDNRKNPLDRTSAGPQQTGEAEPRADAIVVRRAAQRHRRSNARQEEAIGIVEAHRQILQDIIDNTPSGVAVFRGDDFLLETFNPAYQVFAPGKQMRGHTFAEIWPEIAGEFVPLFRHVVESGQPTREVDRQVQIRRDPGGPLEDAYFTYNLVRLPPNERGEAGLLVTAVDTTEQVRARQRLEEASRQTVISLAQLEAVLDTMTDAVVIVDPRGKVTRMNRACLELIGFHRIEDLRKFVETHDRVFEESYPDGSQMPIEQSPFSRLLRGESFTGVIVRYRRIDTDKSWIGSVSGGLVHDQSGTVFAGLLTLRDVTQLRALEESREDFLRAITHDLRTPLTAVLGGAQLLQRIKDRPVLVEKTASMIEGNAKRMTRMVRELADVASLEAGKLLPKIEPVDIASAVYMVKDRLDGVGGGNRITVAIDDPPPLARGDPDLLDRIITNLLTNAVKYSSESSDVVVRITFDRREVTTAVIDHGEGIAAEHLPRLFDRYFRVPNVETRREGLGLGLYITRGLVRALGGRIWVTSQLGLGSTFSFALPRFT